MSVLRRLIGAAAALLAGLALWQLESSRHGLSMTALKAGETPASVYRLPDAKGPAVIIAHGFAGSRQLMEAYALTLAHAGYVAVSFDFPGHGRNPKPMTGDVTRIEGTTRQLVAETAAVIDAAVALDAVEGPVVLLGHSMATDILVRQAAADSRVAVVVAVSMYSEAVTAEQPARLLMISGAWERHLRAVALETLRLVDPQAGEGETAVSGDGTVVRRAAVAPRVEHVGVLYSAAALEEALVWIDAALGRVSERRVAATGPWIALLLGSLLALAWPLAALLPEAPNPRDRRPQGLPLRSYAMAVLLPAVLTPLLLYPLSLQILPVLVADYLLLHLLVYGLIGLAVLRWRGVRFGPLALLPLVALLAFGLGVFGVALDRYAASFLPHAGRLPIILALTLGAVPFMLADSLVTEAGRAPIWRALTARAAFLASLGLAVALDFERLFFLLLIVPVIVLFFLVFGLMGRWVGRRSAAPLACGLGLGAILAWALGVSFPLVAN
ncbi:MAG TPA: alpha/beta fold hydrolase [Kiloniellaceae bacterium]|nr:alpha/beta fold hydrolase [Kiloniellaceae bacterium]